MKVLHDSDCPFQGGLCLCVERELIELDTKLGEQDEEIKRLVVEVANLESKVKVRSKTMPNELSNTKGNR